MKFKTLKTVHKYLSSEKIYFHQDENNVSIELSQKEINDLIKGELGYSVKKLSTQEKHLSKIINDCALIALKVAKENRNEK